MTNRFLIPRIGRSQAVSTSCVLLALFLLGGCASAGGAGPPGATGNAAPSAAPSDTPDDTPGDAPRDTMPAPDEAPGVPADAAGRLYGSDGRVADVRAIVRQSRGRDVVFMGESHGDPGAHALQLQILEGLIEDSRQTGREVVLSMEMFERDVQLVVDEYLLGLITEDQFLAAARPWPEYHRDYRPLVELARQEGLRVVAANAPRRYANRVSRLGVESLNELPPAAMHHLPDLPFPGPSAAYRAEWDALMGQMGHGAGPTDGDDRALQAQALWDAAMAESIHRALGGEAAGTGPLVLHIAGSFHIKNRTGTPEALRHYRPGVTDLVVTTRPVEDPHDFQAGMEGASALLGDFILLTPRASPAMP